MEINNYKFTFDKEIWWRKMNWKFNILMKITILYSASYKGRQTERHWVKIVDPS